MCNSNRQSFGAPPPPQYGDNYTRAQNVLKAITDNGDVQSVGHNQTVFDEASETGISNIDTKAVKDMFTEEYLQDLATFKSMNLLDAENLDELYSFVSTMEKCQGSTSTLFLMMYRAKYPELFQKYQSIESYLLFVFMSITSNGFEKFKKIFGSIGPVVNNFIPTKLICTSRISQLRNKRHSDQSTDGSSVNVSEPLVKKTNSDVKKPIHPMMLTTFYLQKKILFNIGEMYKYLIPIDFAISEATCTKCVIKIYDPKNKRDENGAEIRLRVPVLCRLITRSVSSFTYNCVDNSDNILEFATKCFGFNTNQINISTKINQPIIPVIDFLENCKNTDNAESTFAITTTFSFYMQNEKTVNGRCFSEKLFIMKKSDREGHTIRQPEEEDPGAFDELEKYNETLNKYNAM